MKNAIQNSIRKLLLIATFCLATGNLNAQSWVQRGSDIDGEYAGDYSGISVAFSYKLPAGSRLNT